MCNECAFKGKVCDACGKLATFCCSKCRIRLCYKCNIDLTLRDLKKIDCQEEFIIPSTNSPKLEIEPKPKKEIKAIGINLQETLKFLDRQFEQAKGNG